MKSRRWAENLHGVGWVAALVILGLSTAGCSARSEQPEVAAVPLGPQELFGVELVKADKTVVPVAGLKDKIVGLYFSAHWCPPCRAFTPKLVEFYNQLKQQNRPFEIVFVSSDRDEAAMFTYMREMKMPWLAVPFDDSRKDALKKQYEVRGIPTLVVLGPDGSTTTRDGRSDVMTHGAAAFDEWQKR